MSGQNLAELFTYRIDAADAITYVGEAWLLFAADNEAPELTREVVLGQPIWRFIAGEETSRLYREIVLTLRQSRAEATIPFRCDSPTVIRQMALTLRSLPDGGVEFEGRLLSATTRPPVAVFSRWAERSEAVLPICSLCRLIRAPDGWLEAAQAVATGRLFNATPVPRLEETVCPSCNGLRGGRDT
jgi:hypothetical protein